jgi:hypothetical protein
MNINDIPFEPRFSEKEMKAAKDFLIEEKPKFGMTANFAIVTEDGIAHHHRSQQCHRGISLAMDAWGPRSLVATENGTLRKSGRKQELTEGFLRWFVQESYYGRFIVEKDLDFCRNYGFIISADIAAPLLQNICIITRHFYEVCSQAFSKFDELIASGVPGNVAYPFCFNTGWSDGMNTEISVVQPKSGHRATPLFNLEAFRNFLSGDLGTLTKIEFALPHEHYRVNKAYTGGTKFFFNNFADSPYQYDIGKKHILYNLVATSQEFRNGLAEYRGEGSVVAYRPPNPFAPKAPGKRNPEDLTYRELWEYALPWCVKNIFTPSEERANG